MGVGVAAAKKKPPVTFSGATTCSVSGKVTYSPALTTAGTGSSTAIVSGSLSHCNNANQGGVNLTGGHLQGLKGTVTPNDCSTLASGAEPALSGGSVHWTPTAKVVASTGVSFPVGVGSIVMSGGNNFLEFSYAAGSVASGSFPNSGGSSLTVTSTQNTTQLQSKCANGLSSIAFKGSATL
jgi:hypothetical protein